MILVIGSSNTDIVVKTSHLPRPGETIIGGESFFNFGGKGCNQAVAADRLGGKVRFITKLGEDVFGAQTIQMLAKEGILTDYIFITPDFPSGLALITVDERGENLIVVAPGANMAFTQAEIESILPAIEQADIILLQLEIPLEIVEWTALKASELGKTVILNPAPARALSDSLLQSVTILTPNQIEAELLTQVKVDSPETAILASKKLCDRGVKNVIITLGSQGAFLYNQDTAELIPGYLVQAVDTTAAGDTFNGALAVAIEVGEDLPKAISQANKAAAISVTRNGAQSSIPYKHELESFA